MVQINEFQMEKIVNFLKVMADRSRFKLLALLSEREYTVKELAEALSLKEPTVSWHLTMLRNHDMVDLRQEGTSRYYRLKQEDVHALLKDLMAKAKADEAREDADDYERQVLNTFFQKEGVREVKLEDRTITVVQHRLKEIPTQRKKQVIVLRRLAQEFEPGVHYTEKEVNEILKRFHPDFATLRRYLVDNKLMDRDTRLYWRREA
jgi:DNA-binding transcriptional ArsR family regulator